MAKRHFKLYCAVICDLSAHGAAGTGKWRHWHTWAHTLLLTWSCFEVKRKLKIWSSSRGMAFTACLPLRGSQH